MYQQLETALQDPTTLRTFFTGLLDVLIVAGAALSFIPTEANFGGPLAAGLLRDLLRPFRRRVYDQQLDLQLRPIFPTEDLNARIIVTGLESAALTTEEVLAEAQRAGTRPEAIVLLEKIARVKRFDVVTKDDFALVRTYHTAIINDAIAELKDSEKTVIADLTTRRKALETQLQKVLSTGG